MSNEITKALIDMCETLRAGSYPKEHEIAYALGLVEDECTAKGSGACSLGKYGPSGTVQCKYCGEPPRGKGTDQVEFAQKLGTGLFRQTAVTLMPAEALESRVAELEREIEQLAPDAERYRWLKENCLRAVTVSADSVAITDAVIDAARALLNAQRSS